MNPMQKSSSTFPNQQTLQREIWLCLNRLNIRNGGELREKAGLDPVLRWLIAPLENDPLADPESFYVGLSQAFSTQSNKKAA
jgi:hypothetical protein